MNGPVCRPAGFNNSTAMTRTTSGPRCKFWLQLHSAKDVIVTTGKILSQGGQNLIHLVFVHRPLAKNIMLRVEDQRFISAIEGPC